MFAFIVCVVSSALLVLEGGVVSSLWFLKRCSEIFLIRALRLASYILHVLWDKLVCLTICFASGVCVFYEFGRDCWHLYYVLLQRILPAAPVWSRLDIQFITDIYLMLFECIWPTGLVRGFQGRLPSPFDCLTLYVHGKALVGITVRSRKPALSSGNLFNFDTRQSRHIEVIYTI